MRPIARTVVRRVVTGLVCVIGMALAVPVASAQEPALPEGLAPAAENDSPPATQPAEPDLPAGLNGNGDDDGPALPPGLGDQAGDQGDGEEIPLPPIDDGQTPPPADEADDEPILTWPEEWGQLTGFIEGRGGVRTQNDPYQKHASIGEARLQLEWEKLWHKLLFRVRADFLYDEVLDRHEIDLERGTGWLDLREASVAFSPLEFLDVKAGRQVLTWGTGDLLFLNDLFPKDWQSYFTGRDVEYLKAPSDAIKVSAFTDLFNVDFVYTPRFDPDRYITGRRLSYYNGTLGRRAGRDAVVRADIPDDWFEDDEFAARLHRTVDGWELAGYGYWGYWKSPAGQDPLTGRATFPRLNVYGASARGTVAEGIANIEAAYYDSRDDRNGDDPLVSNDQFRFLVGYERDLPQIASDLKVGLQYYLEMRLDYDDYRRTLPPAAHMGDRCRHVLTFRITKLLMNQNLSLGLFAYYSPSDGDAYLRPRVSYKIDDHWLVEAGANVFFGTNETTFFGQFERNSNIFAALRYSF